MKKFILLFLTIMLVGCSKKADVVCTEKTDDFTTKVELYFKDDKLVDAINISEYSDEKLANQVCSKLGDKVKCYKNKIEIVDYINSYVGSNKNEVINKLKSQGMTCK